MDDYDEDDAPTGFFVHESPLNYDPNGPPPVQAPASPLPQGEPLSSGNEPAPAALMDAIGDSDSEPPTAIHEAYRGDVPIPRAGAVPQFGAPPVPAAGAPAPVSQHAAPAWQPPAAPAAPARAAPTARKATMMGLAPPPGLGMTPAAPQPPAMQGQTPAPIPGPPPAPLHNQPPMGVAPVQSHPGMQPMHTPAPMGVAPVQSHPGIQQQYLQQQHMQQQMPMAGMQMHGQVQIQQAPQRPVDPMSAMIQQAVSESQAGLIPQSGVSQPTGSRPFHTPTSAAAQLQLVDPSRAPTWMMALAFTTIASAATVLVVLGWMISQRF